MAWSFMDIKSTLQWLVGGSPVSLGKPVYLIDHNEEFFRKHTLRLRRDILFEQGRAELRAYSDAWIARSGP